ncbi:MAG: hypothetical protein M3Y24_01755 [Acidobacteriota bacterium]|nr:hypothetical protein [Acidobacteriota bacterium]
MQPALLIRLRPSGPWRYGPEDGSLDSVDLLYRSDRLFSAVTIAMRQLGFLDEWLDSTARATQSEVVFGSLFPFQGETLFAIPPATIWPPPPAQITAPSSVFLVKFRWKTARFVPLTLIDSLMTGGPILVDQWVPDGESGCLLRRDRPSASPFRTVVRRSAPVDRLDGTAPSAVSTACVEFEPGAGLWTLARYRDSAAESTWNERIEAAFRLLADTGFGGKRTSGWGQTHAPEFQRGRWPGLLLPKVGQGGRNGSARDESNGSSSYWLLSLYSPSPGDRVDWRKGDYEIAVRAGRIEGAARSGIPKKLVRMVNEGSVLVSARELSGVAVDVAPDGFEHPVYRFGLALALEFPVVAARTPEDVQAETRPVEEPQREEDFVKSCDTPNAEKVDEAEAPSLEEEAKPAEEAQPDPETQSEPPVPEPAGEEPEEPKDAL